MAPAVQGAEKRLPSSGSQLKRPCAAPQFWVFFLEGLPW